MTIKWEGTMKKLLCAVSLAILLWFTFACQNKAEKAELEKFRTQAKIEEQNEGLFRKLIEEWNKGNYEYLKEMMAPDYVAYSPSANPKAWSKEETLEAIKGMREGFPDGIWSIEQLVAAGDMVITRNIFSGTHTGPYQGIAPTGNRIKVSFILMTHISNGKLVEEREEFDVLGLMMQLGMELRPKEAEKK
jgi:predicted ester cyclase